MTECHLQCPAAFLSNCTSLQFSHPLIVHSHCESRGTMPESPEVSLPLGRVDDVGVNMRAPYIWTSHPKISMVKSSSTQAGSLIHHKLVNMCKYSSCLLCMELVWSHKTSSPRSCRAAGWYLTLSHHGTEIVQSSAGSFCHWFRFRNGTTPMAPSTHAHQR